MINVGLGLLINGVAGALAALGCRGKEKKNPSYLYLLENNQQYRFLNMNMFLEALLIQSYILLVLFSFCFVEKS